jgi:hypothetical protein
VSKTLRCTICDKVNNYSLQNLPDSYIGGLTSGTEIYGKSWFPDPHDPLNYICFECNAAINEVLTDFNIEDTLREEETPFSLDSNEDDPPPLFSAEIIELFSNR